MLFILPFLQEAVPAAAPETSQLPPFEFSAEWALGAWEHYSDVVLQMSLGFAPKLLAAGLVIWIGSYIAGRVFNFVHARTEASPRIDTTLGNFLSSLIKYILLIAFLLLAVSILGIELTSVFVVLSAMTLAIGLALQGSMANVAAGFLLVLTRPYRVGDFVELCGDEGTVEDLNIFTTTLRTLDNVKIILSNGAVRSETIRNYSSLGRRRVDIVFGIDYDDDMNKAIDIIKTTAGKHELVLTDQEQPWAKVSYLNDSSVDIQLRVWCKPKDYWDVRFDLLKSVKEAFDSGGISIPYPHAVEIERP